jgi:NAD(P)-dependent dehydrogenase (short-subunit alcohol dehydrogenase family)
MSLQLNNKVAIITGATGGIGFATAQKFLKNGAKVMMVDLNEAELKKMSQSLDTGSVKYCVADVSKSEQVKNYVSQTVKEFGGVDIVFANAGIEGHAGSLCDVSEEDFDRVMSVNVKGVFLAIKYASPEIKKRGAGSILITSSVAGMRGAANLGPYVTSKHALVGLMKTAAAELGAFQIRVNTINPGPVDNRMMRSIEKQFSEEHPEAVKSEFEKKIPLGRYAKNDDVADLALFLASDQSRYSTAGLFTVDGGYTAT